MDSVNSYSNSVSSAAIVNNNGKQEIYVWGDNSNGQLGLGDTNNRLVPTLLDSSRLGNYTSIKELKFSISGTISATVNTDTSEQIYVWGYNISGQLGLGDTTNKSSPVLFNTTQFGDFLRIKEFNLGGSSNDTDSNSSYAILSTSLKVDKIYVWGQNNFGQLGLGDKTNRTIPTLFNIGVFGSNINIKGFGISNYISWAIIEIDENNDSFFVWGSNVSGQLGTGNTNNLDTPRQLTYSFFNNAKIKFFSSKYSTSLLVLTRNGVDELYTWGYNQFAQVGNGTTTNTTTPYRISQSSLGGATKIISAVSYYSTYVTVEINGKTTIYGWGQNTFGTLGLGDTNQRTTPAHVGISVLGNFTEIYDSSFTNQRYNFVSSQFAYVKTPSGDRLYVWGLNGVGQLGLGDINQRNVPTQINSFNLSTAKIKSFGQSIPSTFQLTLDTNGLSSSYASGANNLGQLGNGNTTGLSSFTPILPTRYTNPQPKVTPTPNITSSQALELINPNNNLVRTELDKYVDTTSFPAGATLSIDPATTTSDYKNGILNLGIKTNQYNDLLIVNTVSAQKTFNVTIPGFRPVTDVNTNPVSVIIRDADGNNIDKIYDQLVDSTYKVINRDLLEYYFDLSSIPPNAVIHLYRTSFGNNTEATFTLTASQVYGNNGLIVSNQLYVKTDLVWTFTSSQLNLALVISLSVVGGLLLIGAIIAIMLVRRSSNRLII